MHDECVQFNQNILANLVIVNTSQEVQVDQTLRTMDHPHRPFLFGLGLPGSCCVFVDLNVFAPDFCCFVIYSKPSCSTL